MSEIMNHIIFQNNTINENNNFLYSLNKLDVFTSIFNIYNVSALKKEIKLNTILAEEKKYNDKNIIYFNFNYILNNLLNMFNKNEISYNSTELKMIKDKNIKKKTIDIKNDNNSIQFNSFLKNIRKIKQIKEYRKIFLKKKLSHQIQENKNQYKNNIKQNNQTYKLNNINKVKNLQFSKIRSQDLQKKIKFCKEKINIIHDNKKIALALDFKIAQNNLERSNIDNKFSTIINNQYKSNILNQEEFESLNIQKIVLKSSNNFIEWKNSINQKILSLISKNYSQVKINLKPESLGSINIIINMKNDNIILQFVSTHNKVRMLLNECVPFLSNELKKQGIKLKKCNIFSSFKHYTNNNYKTCSKKYINDIDKFEKKINIYEKEINFIKYKRTEKTDWYV